MELYKEVFLATCLTMPQDPIEEGEFAEGLFLPGRALGDWEGGSGHWGLLQEATKIYKDLELEDFYIVLNGQANVDQAGVSISTSYVGPEPWEHLLIEWDIPSGKILRTTGGQHTGTESVAFIEFAKDRSWTKALVLANPHQMLRIMMTFVKAMEIVGYHLDIVPVAPSPSSQEWNKKVFGSQGAKQLPRWQHAFEEAARIRKYLGSEFMCTFEELQAYYRLK